MNASRNAAGRFWAKVTPAPAADCWEWSAGRDRHGYGRFYLAGRELLAHRWAYEDMVGEIPAELVIDHLCRNRGCVNPFHLEPVTPLENTRRSAPAQKRFCSHGHEFTPENTYRKPSGQRQCKECRRAAVRRHRARAEVAA